MKAILKAWLKASRPASQLYLAIPLIAGTLWWGAAGGQLDVWWVLFVQLFGVLDQLFIVYTNDLFDYESDRLNQTHTPFSGGSRVLVDGDLSRASLARAAILTLFLALASSAAFMVMGRLLSSACVVIAVLLLVLYSCPPFRLNYRGGGELLQAAGTGLVLPVLAFHAHAGPSLPFPWILAACLLPAHVGCAISTSLPDEISDRQSGKNSASALLGQRWSWRAATVMHGLAIVLTTVYLLGKGDLLQVLSGVALPVAAFCGWLVFRRALPGSRGMVALVASSILLTLTLTLAVGILYRP